MQLLASFFLTLLVFAAPAADAAAQAELMGRVVGITDGDTVHLLTADKHEVKIRLAEIDAPEKSQPYGMASKQALSALCFAKTVRAVVVDHDRYGRTVARLYAGTVDINSEMVREGAAWVYIKYLHDRSLLTVEAEARAAKRGLWGLQADQRIPPWEWRKRE